MRDWTPPLAKIHYTSEQLWGDRLRTVVRNLELNPVDDAQHNKI